jgi:hypothetical protein
MTDHELELRLLAVARALDAEAPALDSGVLARRRRSRRTLVVVAAIAALVGMIVAPAAVSAFDDVFGVESVPELGSVPPDVAAPFGGRQVPLEGARWSFPFTLRSIPSLGDPDSVHVRDDVGGGMVTFSYDGPISLTQWSANEVNTRITVVPESGTADELVLAGVRALWVAGNARGTFTVVGADGALHHELFEVDAGALLWEQGGIAFLLQGAASKADAAQLAADVRP